MPKPIAVALYAVLDTCLVIDSGANNTVMSPLVNLEVITSAVRSIPVGGTHLTRLLFECIRTKGIDASVNPSILCMCMLSKPLGYTTSRLSGQCQAQIHWEIVTGRSSDVNSWGSLFFSHRQCAVTVILSPGSLAYQHISGIDIFF